MRRTLGRRVVQVVSAVCLVLTPALGWAQGVGSGIAGVVRDTSGAVLPGVNVEASSPALIEKTRTAVTDSEGQYKLLNLTPGTFTVTFSLEGFSTVKREGVELSANFTASVNAEMKVGALEESITVSGAAPLVDIQNTVQAKTLSSTLLQTVPSSGGIAAYIALTPAVNLPPAGQDVGGSAGEQRVGAASVHGTLGADMRLLMDGMRYNSAEGGGRGIFPNPAASSEINMELGSNSAESELGGVQVNLIPKSGGNAFSAFGYATATGKGMQSDNLTAALKARGLTSASKVNDIFDGQANIGGPIKKDKLWFFSAHRFWGERLAVSGLYNTKDLTAFKYEADPNHQSVFNEIHRADNIRFSWQANQKNQFTLSYDNQWSRLGTSNLLSGTIAVESSLQYYYMPSYMFQATWKHPTSNKLLFDVGATTYIFNWHTRQQTNVVPGIIPILERSRNFVYRASTIGTAGTGIGYGIKIPNQTNGRFNVSYVTGSHVFKTGVFLQNGDRVHENNNNGDQLYQVLNGVPTSITEFATPLVFHEHLRANVGVYGQDQWTIKRLTLNLGLRFDYLNSYVPPQSLPAAQFVPARNYGEVDCVPCWKDLNPRLGGSLDIFGNGKTAVKGSLGRYVIGEFVGTARLNNPESTSVTATTRTWNDANLNLQPDCDLKNPALNGECGPIDNANFGLNNPRAATYASDVLTGFGKRGYSWQASASVQQEVRSGMSVGLAYFRTWYGNLQASDNLQVTPTDFDPFSVTAPLDARLPGGGGEVESGLYDVNPAKFGKVQTVVTQASHYGKPTQVYNGLDLTINLKLPHSSMISGGLTTGQTVTNNCYVVDDPTVLRNCKVTLPMKGQTQLKLVGAYPLPWWGLQASATFQSLPGIPILASYIATNAQIAPSLGRNLSAGTNGTATLDLIVPNTQFEHRLDQLDLRFSKETKVGSKKLKGMFDLYNSFNSSTILSQNTRYGTTWRTPTQILDGRLAKIGFQVEF